MSTTRAPVMADVARLAGVSHMTVSRVLNGHPSVSGETRERVRQAVATLGYRRNETARALASRRSSVVGVLALESTLFGPSSTLFAIERAARAGGFSVSVTTPDPEAEDPIGAALDRLVRLGVEGVVAIAPRVSDVDALASLPSDVATVVVEGGQGAGRPVVAVDQAGGAKAATRHLLDQGAEMVWHVAGPSDWFEAQAREAGWRAALASVDLEPPAVVTGDWSPTSGYELAEQLDVRPGTGIFVANDQMALGVLRSLHERGLRVPDDVLVAGFDDIPEAGYFTPPLTTVRQDFEAVGREAIAVLLRGFDEDPVERLTTVASRLVVRASSRGLA